MIRFSNCCREWFVPCPSKIAHLHAGILGIFENRLYDGIPQMLRTLNSKGMFLAVASSKPTVFVERILEHFGIRSYFKAVVGSELDGTRTEKNEVVEEALRQLFGDEIGRAHV